MSHNPFAAKDFSKRTLKALSSKGIAVTDTQMVPGDDGSWANGEVCYVLDNNGTGQVRSFLDVLDLSN